MKKKNVNIKIYPITFLNFKDNDSVLKASKSLG